MDVLGVRIEILFLIGIVYFLFIAHTVGNCCNFSNIKEGMKQSYNASIEKIREKQQSDFFADTPFSLNCCPSAYSSRGGCPCMSVEQTNMLATRGGNNHSMFSFF